MLAFVLACAVGHLIWDVYLSFSHRIAQFPVERSQSYFGNLFSRTGIIRRCGGAAVRACEGRGGFRGTVEGRVSPPGILAMAAEGPAPLAVAGVSQAEEEDARRLLAQWMELSQREAGPVSFRLRFVPGAPRRPARALAL